MIKDCDRIAIIAGERNISFPEMLEHIHDYAQKMQNRKGERTLIFADNCVGWIYAFYSVWANGGIPVPVDASSTVSDVAYILNDCKPSSVWTNAKRHDVLQEALNATGTDVKVLLIEDYENNPTQGSKAKIEYKEEDTAVIIYTSGTTGSPKGVMLSFLNLLVNIRAVTDEIHIFNGERRTMILLPLHHVLPLVGTIIMPMYDGGGVALCPSLSAPDIMDTLQRGQIAIMIGVPRLWQTLYNGIKKKIDEKWISRTLFNICAKIQSPALSRTIFKAVHQKMGGHIAYFVSGGAPLAPEIIRGITTLGIGFIEGYGMTEAAPMIAFSRPGELIPGSVGLPLNAMECKIINGEICAKGPNVMQGYYNRPEETAAVIDQDGFLHTGDLGRVDEKGNIFITGRCKEIIVLSNGKNVQPAEIEYKLEKYNDRVKEAAVVQDGDLLKAIIVPQKEWADALTDEEAEEALKREVLEPYNLTVTNYKKLMSLMVYRGDLPRTKLEKLQRFKLKEILANRATPASQPSAVTEPEPDFDEYRILKEYIESDKKIQIKATDHIETDLAFDSLDMVTLEGFIQQTFGTEVPAGTMPSYRNIEALARYIAESKTRMEVEVEDWHSFLHADHSALELPRACYLLPLSKHVSKLWFKLYHRVEIKGQENIPAQGPFIIAPNHQSYLDGPLVTSGLPTNVLYDTYFFAKEDHVKSARRKALARNMNIILMERSNLRNSIGKLAQVLRGGKNLVIFPEGVRSNNGQVGTFKKTFAILSAEINVPIVPVRISGAYESLSRNSHFVKPHKIVLEYLPPIVPEAGIDYDVLAERVKKAIVG